MNWDIRQMNTNDIKLVLFLRLKTDLNVTREDVTLANLIAEQNRFTESQWKSDLTDALIDFDKRQTAKFEELKDDLGVIMLDVLARLNRIEETCKAAASKDIQRKDDDDHEDDPTADEGEKKTDTAGTSTVDQSQSKDKAKASKVQYERRFKRTDISKVFLTKEERKKVLEEVFGESSEEDQEVRVEQKAQTEHAVEQEGLREETVDRTILSQVFDRLKQQDAYAEQQTQVPPTITYTEEDRQKLLEESRRVNEAYEQLLKKKKEEKKRMSEDEESRVVMGYIPPVDYTWSLEYHLQQIEEHELMKAKEEEDKRMKREEEQKMIGFRPWDQSVKAVKPKKKSLKRLLQKN